MSNVGFGKKQRERACRDLVNRRRECRRGNTDETVELASRAVPINLHAKPCARAVAGCGRTSPSWHDGHWSTHLTSTVGLPSVWLILALVHPRASAAHFLISFPANGCRRAARRGLHKPIFYKLLLLTTPSERGRGDRQGSSGKQESWAGRQADGCSCPGSWRGQRKAFTQRSQRSVGRGLLYSRLHLSCFKTFGFWPSGFWAWNTSIAHKAVGGAGRHACTHTAGKIRAHRDGWRQAQLNLESGAAARRTSLRKLLLWAGTTQNVPPRRGPCTRRRRRRQVLSGSS